MCRDIGTMTEERLPPVAEDSEVDEGSMGGEEWETEISEFETSSVYSSTFTHSSEYDGGSAKLNGVLLNLVLAICVVVALIAHVQLGKSELTTPPKAGGITPELLGECCYRNWDRVGMHGGTLTGVG